MQRALKVLTGLASVWLVIAGQTAGMRSSGGNVAFADEEPEAAVVVTEPRIRSSFAYGKVLSVQRYEQRYAAEISLGKGDGIQTGIATAVYVVRDSADLKMGEYPRDIIARGQVVDAGEETATCNLGPPRRSGTKSVPQVGDTVVVRKKHRIATFVVAKDVVVHDGRILDWTDVRGRLAELHDEELIAPSFRYTSAVRPQRKELLREFDQWCTETTGRASYSYGSVGTSVSRVYDAISKSQRVLRDASRRKVGIVTSDGRPVARAEIVVCTLEAGWIHEIYLEHGQLRDPYSEPSRTLTELNGKFDVFPESDRFQLLVLHDSGMALVNSEQWPDQPEIVLQPWASIEGHYSSPAEFDEMPHFESRQQRDGWAELRLEVWNTPLHADRTFKNRWIPPGNILVTRAVKSPRGGATSIRHREFELASGEKRQVSLGPLSEAGRKKANDYLRREGGLEE